MIENLPPGPATDHLRQTRRPGVYAALLQHVFPDELVIVRQETAELGVYACAASRGGRSSFAFWYAASGCCPRPWPR